MSTSLRLQMTFSKISSIFGNGLFSKPLQTHRAATQLDFTRGRRRRRRREFWRLQEKNRMFRAQTSELTYENKGFLHEVVVDRFKNSPLKNAPWERHPWNFRTIRSGTVAIKLGSYPLYLKNGRKQMCVLLQVLDNHVIRYKTPEEFTESLFYDKRWKQRYGAVVVGAISSDPFRFTKDYNMLFEEAGVPPKRKLAQFIVTHNAALQPGTPLYATHYKVGQYIDVKARTIGHGFQGVVKRWGFKGGPATHGSSKFHRRTGSIGKGGKGVMRGKKMPGRMGFKWRKKNGYKIVRINTKYNVLYVAADRLPGPNHCYTHIYDCCLPNRRREQEADPPPMPTFYPDLDATEPLPEEINHESLFDFSSPSIVYEEEKDPKKKKVVTKK